MFARTNRTWWIVGILGCLAMSAVAVWFGIAATAGRVGWQTQSYAVLDDQSVTVTFRVESHNSPSFVEPYRRPGP